MIGKISKGKNFSGVLKYVEQKHEARLIGGNMLGRNAYELAAQFRVSEALNDRVERPVFHASLSLPSREKLTDNQWSDLAQRYLEKMDFDEDHQWVAYRHSDTEHEHIHIIASRISVVDGHAATQEYDYYRSQEAIRELEKEFDLQPVPCSWQQSQKMPQSEVKGRRPKLETDRGKESKAKIDRTKQFLQSAISFETRDHPSFSKFVSRLNDQGIRVGIKQTRTGKIQGISYEMDGVALRGSRLGSSYTWNGIQNKLGVTVEAGRDRAALNQAAAQHTEMQTGATEKQKMRRKYRDKYREYSAKAVSAAEKVFGENYTRKQIDYGVAIQATKQMGFKEAEKVLLLSDQVREWQESEKDIERVVELASDYIDQVKEDVVGKTEERESWREIEGPEL